MNPYTEVLLRLEKIQVATNLTGVKGFGSGIGAFICKTIEPGGEFVEGPDWIE